MNYQLIELDVDQPTHTKIKTQLANNIDDVQPILELYKGKIYTSLVKTFTNDCIAHFGVKIFSVKKSVSRTLTNLLSSWIFSLYIEAILTLLLIIVSMCENLTNNKAACNSSSLLLYPHSSNTYFSLLP